MRSDTLFRPRSFRDLPGIHRVLGRRRLRLSQLAQARSPDLYVETGAIDDAASVRALDQQDHRGSGREDPIGFTGGRRWIEAIRLIDKQLVGETVGRRPYDVEFRHHRVLGEHDGLRSEHLAGVRLFIAPLA
jgi:hypothetical protein